MLTSGLIPINKPAGMSSHDVVNRLRRILGTRKVGHCGTLDEMATGVLPVCFGRATRACDYAQSADKSYRATLKLGLTTTTEDIWGEALSVTPSHITEEAFRAVLPQFTGHLAQIPPMYSALKKDGQKLYDLARKGIEVAREARQIQVFSITLHHFDEAEQLADLSFDCSKGTYIRTLCHDIGAALGVGGVMASLIRTRNGKYSLENCFTIEELQAHAAAGTLDDCILPVETVFSYLPRYALTAAEEGHLRNGRVFPSLLSAGQIAAFAPSGEFIGLCEVEDGICRLVKGFYETEKKEAGK